MITSINQFKRIALVNTAFIILPGYVLLHYLGLDTNDLFLVLSCLCLLLGLQDNHWGVSRGVFFLAFGLCFIGAIGSFFSGVWSQFLMTVSFSVSILIASTGRRVFADPWTLNYLSVFCWILIAGAIFAFLYAIAGGPPLEVIDLFGRKSYFYLTTFTNSVNGNLIRPAGIFDEPGALAMFITLIVALNESLGINTKWSAALLFSALVTGSFALLFIVAAYLFFKGQQRNYTLVLVLVTAIGGLVYFDKRASTISEEFFLKRLEIVDGRLAGDNRTLQVDQFFELVDWEITLKGSKAISDNYRVFDQSSNPFSIYYGYGIFVWIVYVALEIWLLSCVFLYRPNLRFPALAIFLTLLQRPYIFNLHWGMMIAVVVFIIYYVEKEKV